jgi:hypothetical protein
LTLALLQGAGPVISAAPPDPGEVEVIADGALRPLGLALADEARARRDWLGVGPIDLAPMTIVVVPDADEFARWSRGRVPRWGAGLTVPSRRLIVIRVDAGRPFSTLRHELAHLALHTRVPTRVPLWFAEGYAALAAGEHGRLNALQLNLAVAVGRVPGLGELDATLRGSTADAGTGYALAASAVAEIARRHPTGELDPMIDRLAGGMPFDEALQRSTGLDASRFAEEWHRAVRRRYNFGLWLLAGGAWTIVALLLGVAVAHRRRQDAPRRAALNLDWPMPPPDDEFESVDDGSMTGGGPP